MGRSDLEEQPGRSTHREVGVPEPRLSVQVSGSGVTVVVFNKRLPARESNGEGYLEPTLVLPEILETVLGLVEEAIACHLW